MKRTFKVSPKKITASTEFWGSANNDLDTAWIEIVKAMKAGTTMEDIQDYLRDQLESGNLTASDCKDLKMWAEEAIKLWPVAVKYYTQSDKSFGEIYDELVNGYGEEFADKVIQLIEDTDNAERDDMLPLDQARQAHLN